MRVRLAVIVLVAAGCASTPQRAPTRAHPAPGCVLSCPDGWFIHRQHLCRNGRRWFRDILITGEYIVRGSDGEKLIDEWVTPDGDFPKADVERGACSSVIAAIVLARPAEQRGVHPGEENPAHPGESPP